MNGNLATQLNILRPVPEIPHPLSPEEKRLLLLTVESEFLNAQRCMERIEPILAEHSMSLRSGAFSESVGKNIEQRLLESCSSFELRDAGLYRADEKWELKVVKDSGLIINQCTPPRGEHFLVVNYSGEFEPRRVWILWSSAEELFTERRSNSNMRTLKQAEAEPHIQRLAWN